MVSTSHWKQYLLLFFFAILIGCLGYFYYSSKTLKNDVLELQGINQNLETEISTMTSFEKYKKATDTEITRCKNFLASDEKAERIEFQYCENFIEWAAGIGK